jgi:hypothetical protein
MTRPLLTNFLNKNENDYDEHLSTILFLYHITFKVATSYTPNLTLVYGLHPLMLIEYILPSLSGKPWDTNLIRVLMNHLYDLEKL